MNPFLITLDDLYLENTVGAWLQAFAIAASVLVCALLVRSFVRSRYQKMLKTERIEFLELPFKVAGRTTTFFLLVAGLFAGLLTLDAPDIVHQVARKVLMITTFWQVGVWASTAALSWLEIKRNNMLEHDRASAGTLSIVAVIIRALIWSVVLLLTLDNLGVNITTLVAGLGIGGIAVALAVQKVLGDLLASLSITLDKPFVLGDFLIVDEYKGTVEHIGIKSTRLRSLDGEQIIMPNSDLLASRVRNYGRMYERRVLFSVGVTYETSRDKLERLPQLVRDIVEAQKNVRLERCHLARLGSYSIDCEVVYFVLSKEYGEYMDIQQAINLRLIEVFEREQIEFAYPTQKQWTAAVPGTPMGSLTD